MECKFCGAELEEGSSVCLVCGQDNEAETKKNSVSKLIVGIVGSMIFIAMLMYKLKHGKKAIRPGRHGHHRRRHHQHHRHHKEAAGDA